MHASLIEINKVAYQYSEPAQEQLKEICMPLSYLDITYFGYMKIFNNGSFFKLTNNLNFQKDYFFHDGGFGGIFSNIYSNTKNTTYFLTPNDPESLRKDHVIELAKYHNIWDTFNIYKNINGCVHGYFFGTATPSSALSHKYFNNILLLERFISYFDEQAKDLIDTTDHKKLGCFDHKFNFGKISDEKILNEKIESFLKKTYLPRLFSKNKNEFIQLTKREAECLHYLSYGKTMKEIGRILGLTPKTIEFYLRNIKEKSGYKSREELLISFNSAFYSNLERRPNALIT